ncbi:hypothetical protein [Variovorax saccharolyticus]|uniref:hypothetical protein n=1 Tax=Variovorax saccharolyticus TaxID=3053516 RepID=UPI00257784C6|nr:hypothetical protein [Variovorax sp. J31P216]MDM0028887.1 hypothetical protein [Variovorax sp. J31P216]
MTIEEFSLSLTRRRRGTYFDQVQLHGELTNLALERFDLGFVIRLTDASASSALSSPPVVLRQPKLKQVGGWGVLLGASRRPMAPLRMSWHR